MKTKWIAAALLAVATIAVAQQPYFETFELRLHNLDVLVTDAKGNPVHGLQKEDFIVLENGVAQDVTNFSVYDRRSTKVSSANANPSNAQAQQAEQTEAEAVVPPRRFVFFVDDMAVRKHARTTLIKHATALVNQMQPGDLGAVIRPTGSNRIAQFYTDDHVAVRNSLSEAIESCEMNVTAPGQFELEDLVNGLENATAAGDKKFARALYAQRVSDRVQQRLSQLRALVGSLASVEGRKVLVLITSGLPALPGRDAVDYEDQMRLGVERAATEWGQGGDLNPLIDELARTAAANGVTIYALEPELPLDLDVRRITAGSRTAGTTNVRDLKTQPATPNTTPASSLQLHVRGEQIVPTSMMNELLHYRGQTLTSLSEKTGGKWSRGPATIDDLFRQVASDLSTYYSLAYRATGERDKPRRVEVKVRNRPDLKVRTRTEVIDRSPEREMSDQVAATLLFPRELNELKLKVEVTSAKPESPTRAVLPIDIVIPMETLTFVRPSDDKYLATIDVHFATSGEASDYTTTGRHRQQIEITDEQYAGRIGANYRFKSGVLVPRGPSKVAIGVMDQASRMTSFRTMEVNTP